NRLLALSEELQKHADASGGAPDEVSRAHDRLMHSIASSVSEVERLVGLLEELIRQCNELVSEMDFSFLYDREKELFTIGFNVDNAALDNSYYDLLASESRLGSLVAIALGQVPERHWFALGRSLADSEGGKALLS